MSTNQRFTTSISSSTTLPSGAEQFYNTTSHGPRMSFDSPIGPIQSNIPLMANMIGKNQTDYQKQKVELDKQKLENKKLKQEYDELDDKSKRKVKKLEDRIKILEQEIQIFEEQNQAIDPNVDQYKKEIRQLKSKINELTQTIPNLQYQNQMYEQENQELKSKIQQNFNSSMTTNSLFKQQYEQSLQEISKLQNQLQQSNQQINSLNQKIQDQQNKLTIYQYTEEDIKKVEDKVDFEHNNFMEARDEIAGLNKKIQNLNKEITQKDDSLTSLTNQLKDYGYNIKKLQRENQFLQSQIESYKSQLNDQTNGFEALQRRVGHLQLNKDDKEEFDKEWKVYDQLLKKKKQQMIEEEQRQQQIKIQQQNEYDAVLQKRQELIAKQQGKKFQQRQEQLKVMQNNIADAKITHGQLDVCFLVDVTGSMDSYKDQTKQCVQGALKIIKQQTGRITNWSSICYQDKAELKKLGQYHQFNFSKDAEAIQKWFDTIRCTGGGDGPEDIRGGIMQMIDNLKWENKFKIVLLICDAPCHGAKYNGGMGDDYPNDDIRDAIEKIIEQGIILIGLNFTRSTKTMYDEIAKIFADKQKQDLFLFADLTGTDMEKLGGLLGKYIGTASQNATQVNNRSTKSKKEFVRPKNRNGAMEALCKQGNFYNFETMKEIQKVETQFQIYKVELRQDEFENNIENINAFKNVKLFQTSHEGQWNCIRTQDPFAFGMMKDVFLMKKQGNPNELYVIKTPIGSEPYKTIEDAIGECRSHLLCQQLMKKFRKDIEDEKGQKQIQKQFPQVIYSDFLILKESQTRFWIAERFFNGEFVKYNNNNGFINDEPSELNKFAQAFTYYTYNISNFNYMITDVQGVDKYFTDPAVNTIQGDFDDTDMGDDGIRMYLVNNEIKKDLLSREILELLSMFE